MEITTKTPSPTSRKQQKQLIKQQQLQQQQQQLQVEAAQQQLQHLQQQAKPGPHLAPAPMPAHGVYQIERKPKVSGEFVTLSRAKLVMVLATCLLATLFACCSKFRADHYDEKHELEEEYNSARQAQLVVRKYVIEQLKMYPQSSSSSARSHHHHHHNHHSGHQQRRTGHMFAKLILNAYDRSYQQVLDAINQRLREIKHAGNNKEALRSIKPAARMLAEAYGKALENSQRHSLQIQAEIRRSQEQVRNQDGELSKLDELLAQWHLEELADFEERLVSTYLMYALEQEVN